MVEIPDLVHFFKREYLFPVKQQIARNLNIYSAETLVLIRI